MAFSRSVSGLASSVESACVSSSVTVSPLSLKDRRMSAVDSNGESSLDLVHPPV